MISRDLGFECTQHLAQTFVAAKCMASASGLAINQDPYGPTYSSDYGLKTREANECGLLEAPRSVMFEGAAKPFYLIRVDNSITQERLQHPAAKALRGQLIEDVTDEQPQMPMLRASASIIAWLK